jgi:hypothetical protein
MGTAGFFEFQQLRIADRKPWLLSRLAVKDAVRFLIWDDDGTREIFPIEVGVTSDTDGYARVEEWRERKIPAFEASFAHAGKGAVAIARPAGPPVAPGAPGIGIGMVPVPDDKPEAEPPADLSGAELAALDRAIAAEPGTERPVWLTRLRAAREAVAKAEGIGITDAPGTVTITAATAAAVTVVAAGRTYQVSHRETRNPDDMPPKRYVVAWTRGPEGAA